MTKVTVRELLRDFKTLEFPVVVTRWGKPWCVIISWEDWNGPIKEEEEEPIVEDVLENKDFDTTTLNDIASRG